MEKPNSDPSIVKLKDLEKEYYRLEILIDKTNTQIEKETKVSIQAGELIGQIYDELIEQYHDMDYLVGLSPVRQSKGLPSANVYEIIDEYDVSFGERHIAEDEKDKIKEFIKDSLNIMDKYK